MASVARYFNLDNLARQFMAQHERCNIVNLGAGLDTGFHRLSPASAVFYEVDLPDVIEIRRRVLGEQTGEVLIGGDMFELSGFDGRGRAFETASVGGGDGADGGRAEGAGNYGGRC